MNTKVLKKAEKEFLQEYPGGFEHPAMVEIGKKHKKDIITKLALDCFAKSRFNDSTEMLNSIIKVVSQSSMVSLFEKPKFRDMVRALSNPEKEVLVKGLRSQLHGSEKKGFNAVLSVLTDNKMAKWTLMTAIPYYYRPDKDVFIKPTTTKNIIRNLELDLVYNPKPSWEFYEAYRDIINRLKTKVSKSLTPSNAAFCGFLMMAFDKEMR